MFNLGTKMAISRFPWIFVQESIDNMAIDLCEVQNFNNDSYFNVSYCVSK